MLISIHMQRLRRSGVDHCDRLHIFDALMCKVAAHESLFSVLPHQPYRDIVSYLLYSDTAVEVSHAHATAGRIHGLPVAATEMPHVAHHELE